VTVIDRIIASIATSLLGTLCFFALGCGSGNQFNFQGNWLGHRQVNAQPGANSALLNTVSEVKLSIKDNGTFTLVDAGIPKNGDFHQDGDKGSLVITSIMNEPISQQPADVQASNVSINLTPQKNGSILLFDPKGFDSAGITLSRVRGK